LGTAAISSFTLKEVNTCQSIGAKQKTAIAITATQNKILLIEIGCRGTGSEALVDRLESDAVAISFSQELLVVSC
jgi:hypothetical protein